MPPIGRPLWQVSENYFVINEIIHQNLCGMNNFPPYMDIEFIYNPS